MVNNSYHMTLDIQLLPWNMQKNVARLIRLMGLIRFDLLCLTPLSAIFQLYHGDQFQWWKKPERTIDHGQATGKLYHLLLRVESTLFCNLQSRARTHAVLVIGLYELIGNPTTLLNEPHGDPNPPVICIKCVRD